MYKLKFGYLKRPGFLLFATFLSFPEMSNAFDAAVRAPVRCSNGPSCGEDISLAQAQASAASAIAFCQQINDSRQIKRKCAIKSAIEHNISFGNKHISCKNLVLPEYSWARPDSIADGSKALADLRASAQSGDASVVGVDGTPPGEQHFASCAVSDIGGVSGPPRDCKTVAIMTKKITLLRVTVYAGEHCYTQSSATYRVNSGKIDIKYQIQTTLPLDRFAEALRRMLQDDLGMATDSDVRKAENGDVESVVLQATAALRDSTILKGGWRESLDFDLDIGIDGGSVDVKGTSAPMICRQASGNLVDYQIPDDAQRGLYARTLDNLVGKALSGACANGKKVDSSTVVCPQ
jgi:hypothetical protein